MELKELRGKKSLKLLFLLFTALLIGSASATVYNYLYLQGIVTVGSAQIVWVEGSGAPSGTTIAGGLVQMDLSVQAGINQTYTRCLYLQNQNSTRLFNINVTITSPLSASDFNSANVYVYNNATSGYLHTIDMTGPNTYTTTLAGSGVDRLDFQIYAKTTASGNYNFDLRVTYW